MLQLKAPTKTLLSIRLSVYPSSWPAGWLSSLRLLVWAHLVDPNSIANRAGQPVAAGAQQAVCELV